MRLRDDNPSRLCAHSAVYERLLPLAGAHILELGCGKAEVTRDIAQRVPSATITALEVDRVQHERNLAAPPLPNVRFAYGGAEKIPAPDGAFDIAMMVKSLHHVPTEFLDAALAEIRRVLRPGGLAYFAEPVFAGVYNEIIRLFHDEERVRAAAFSALQRAVEGRAYDLVAEEFFLAPVQYSSFADFDAKVLQATHTRHHLSDALLAQV